MASADGTDEMPPVQPPPAAAWPPPNQPPVSPGGMPPAPPAPGQGAPWPPPPGAAPPPGSMPPPPPSAAPAAAAPPPGAAPQPGPHIIQTDAEATDGLAKCARCGASDISLNIETGNLRCGFCRFEMSTANALEAYGLDADIGSLRGTVMGSGSSDIIPSTDIVRTFKCSACGAEVVIDTDSSTQARCHWCRNTLSMNQQVPNGAVPDMILPFSVTKEAAVEHINAFVKKRMAFAHPTFKQEFRADNVMGVYLPYMVIDVNASVRLSGQGEHQTRSYTVKRGDDDVRLYDADLYDVARSFELHINDLTVESSTERLDQTASKNSNNIINSIMPFDVENSVCYDSNYLKGFTSERRDSNVDDLAPIASAQSQDVARYHANDTVGFYDRGVRWDHEQIDVVGQRWVSAYLPVWLYSYYEQKGDGRSFVHYVAVNGRTGETMGSVPINQRKLLMVSAAVEVVALILFLIIMVVA